MDGGSSSQPSTMTQTSIPEYANPYVKAMLGQAMKTIFDMRPSGSGGQPGQPGQPDGKPVQRYGRLTGKPLPMYATGGSVNGYDIVGLKPMETYQGLGADTYRVADFSPTQKAAAGTVAGMAPNLGGAENMTGSYSNAQAGLQHVYNRAGEAEGYNPATFDPNYKQGTFETRSITDQNALDPYMSPYMQKVVDINKREAIRDASKQNLLGQAQATQAGAFGGGRDALMRSENLRNMNQHLGDIQDTGNQAAYQAGIGQFNTEAAQRFEAQKAREQAAQFGSTAGLNAQQMAEQSRQYGFDLQGRALQMQLQAAVAAGQMTQTEADQRMRAGQQIYEQQGGIAGLQSQVGNAERASNQQQIDNAYSDFVNQQNFPYRQYGFMADLSRGLPLSNVSTYQAPPSLLSQAAGLGTAGLGGLGLYNATK